MTPRESCSLRPNSSSSTQGPRMSGGQQESGKMGIRGMEHELHSRLPGFKSMRTVSWPLPCCHLDPAQPLDWLKRVERCGWAGLGLGS